MQKKQPNNFTKGKNLKKKQPKKEIPTTRKEREE